MKSIILLVAWAATQSLQAQEVVTVPWTEFRDLYRQSIALSLTNQISKPATNNIPQTHVIEAANYHLNVDLQRAKGELVMTGKVLGGSPTPITLFDAGMVIKNIESISGGSLISSGEDSATTCSFLPTGPGPFQISLTFLARVEPEANAYGTAIHIPSALQNTLKLELAEGLRLLSLPGIADDEGVFHFSTDGAFTIRFAPTSQITESTKTDVDIFSSLAIQRERIMLTTTLIPLTLPHHVLVLKLPEGAQYLSSSLPEEAASRDADGNLTLKGIHPDMGAFTVLSSLPLPSNTLSLTLPTLDDNNGRSGDFVVQQPADGQATVQAADLVADIPNSSLHPDIRKAVGSDASFMHIPAGRSIQLQIRRFQAVAKPAAIVDSQNLFVTVDDSGTILSVLSLTLPSGYGPFLKIRVPAGSDVWSVMVNGKPRELFENERDDWLIPLDQTAPSCVELSLRKRGDKLGLHGKVEMDMPETGVQARKVRLGITLPSRVDLLSLEGPVNPAPGTERIDAWESAGKVHLFSSTFHTGEGMSFVASYKEPVKLNKQEKK